MLNKRLVVALLSIAVLFLGIFSFAQNNDDEPLDDDKPIIDEKDDDKKDDDENIVDENDEEVTNPVRPVTGLRPTVVADTTDPVITLNGLSEINLDLGGTYTEEGATAKDAVSGDLEVVKSGNVNTDVVGVYTLTYTATDAAGNDASVTRKVTVKPVIVLDMPEEEIVRDEGNNILLTAELGRTFVLPSANALLGGELTFDEDDLISEGLVNVNFLGTYTVIYNFTFRTENGDIKSKPLVIKVEVKDTAGPEIEFGTDGDSNYRNNHASVVKVEDLSGVNAASLKYLWEAVRPEDNSLPTEDKFTLSFINNESVPSTDKLEGSYYLWILAEDTFGNKTIEKSEIFNFDNTKPVVTLTGAAQITLELGVDQYIEGGATATDNFDGALVSSQLIEYVENGKFTKTPVVDTNKLGRYKIWYYYTDVAGNKGYAIRNVYVKDARGPVISFNKNGDTIFAKSHKVISTATDFSTINELRYAWSTETTGLDASTITTDFVNGQQLSKNDGTGSLYLWIYAKDQYDNVTITRSEAFNFDNTAPSIPELNFNGYANGTWTKDDISISFTSTDSNSGVAKYQWATMPKALDKDWRDTNNPFAIKWDLGSTIYIRAIDNAGNVGEASLPIIIKSDRTAPQVVISNNNSEGYAKNYNVSVKVTDIPKLNASSIGSGLVTLKYIWTTKAVGVIESDFASANNFTLNDVKEAVINTDANLTGVYYLWVLAKDAVGNTTIIGSDKYYLDNMGPSKTTVNLNGYISGNWTNQNIKLVFNSIDNESGIAKFQWSTVADNSRNTWYDVINPRTINWDLATTYYVRAIDNLGNVGEFSDPIVIRSDRTAPKIEILPNGNNVGSQTQKAKVKIADISKTNEPQEISGLNTLKYIWAGESEKIVQTDFNNANSFVLNENGEATISLNNKSTGTYYLWILAIDNAGNSIISRSNGYIIFNPVNFEALVSAASIGAGYHGYVTEISLEEGFTFGDASDVVIKLFRNNTLLATNTLINGTHKRLELKNAALITSPFGPYGDLDADGYWKSEWTGRRDIAPNRGVALVTINGITYRKEINVQIDIKDVMPDPITFNALVSAQSIGAGYHGYVTEISLEKGFTFGDASDVVIKLFNNNTLLATNTLINGTHKRLELKNASLITSPFGPYGDLDADGYWKSEWTGKRDIAPNRGVALVTINGVTYRKEINVQIDIKDVMPDPITFNALVSAASIGAGYHGYVTEISLEKGFTFGDASDVVIKLFNNNTLLATNTLINGTHKRLELKDSSLITSPFGPYGDLDADGYWKSEWTGRRDIAPNRGVALVTINGVTYRKEINVQIDIKDVMPDPITFNALVSAQSIGAGYHGYVTEISLEKGFTFGDASDVVIKLFNNNTLLATNTLINGTHKRLELKNASLITSPFGPYGDLDADGYWKSEWTGRRDIAPNRGVALVTINGVTYRKEINVQIDIKDVMPDPITFNALVSAASIGAGYHGYVTEISLNKGFTFGDASDVVIKLFNNNTLLATNTLINGTHKRLELKNASLITSPFSPYGDLAADGYWEREWTGRRDIAPNRGVALVTINGVTYRKEIVNQVELATSPEEAR